MTDRHDERAREIAAPLESALSAWRLRDLETAIAAALRATAEAARREALDALAAETERLGLYSWQEEDR